MRPFLLLACACVVATHLSASAATDLDARVQRLEQWLKAVLHHQPGTTDDSVRAVGAWSIDELNSLAIDQGVLVQLTQNLTLLSTASRPPFIIAGFRRIPYSAAQLHRL